MILYEMNFLVDIYTKKLEGTEKSLLFWKDYLQKLTSLELNFYSDKLTVPALVPIGSRILFRGEIKHTNEVTVALGADYFAKCSLKQAEVLRQHRIKDAQTKVAIYETEKEYLENQISFSKESSYGTEGQEIIESYTEDDDKAWREKHRENVRRYKQDKGKQKIKEDSITDEELWNRLEELELEEELENELFEMKHNYNRPQDYLIIKEEDAINEQNNTKLNAEKSNHALSDAAKIESSITKEQIVLTKDKEQKTVENEKQKKVLMAPVQTPKLELLQQVMDRQNELENKLLEMRNREKSQSKTENDLITKLDEMEQLDELEDEMERLDDILEIEDYEHNVKGNSKSQNNMVKRHVSFADQDDSETLEIPFKHSDVEPDNTPYDAEKAILKPSDIYEAYATSFGEATSILKKTTYTTEIAPVHKENKKTVEPKPKDSEIKQTIIINDVIEKVDNKENKPESETRPTSLFKKRRMQNK